MVNEVAWVVKKCKDCGLEFKDWFDTYTKCTHCRDRDQNYAERAKQERIMSDDDTGSEEG